jgi:hypothetical protein
LSLSHEEVQELLAEMRHEQKAVIDEIYMIVVKSEGSLSRDDVMNMSPQEIMSAMKNFKLRDEARAKMMGQ